MKNSFVKSLQKILIFFSNSFGKKSKKIPIYFCLKCTHVACTAAAAARNRIQRIICEEKYLHLIQAQ